MLPVISQAITYGFSALQILKFLASKFPSLKGSIESAQASGFEPDKILKFLSHKIPHSKEGAQRQVNANDQYLSSIGVKTKEEREASRNRALSGVLGVGAGALGTYAMSRAVPQILQQFGGLGAGANPANAAQGTTAGMQQAPQVQQLPTIPPVIPQATALKGQAQAAQSQQGQQAASALPQRNVKASLELLKNIGEEGRVSNLLQGGLPPKDVAGVLRKLLPKDKLQALESSEGGLEGLIEDVAASRQAEQIEGLGGLQSVVPPEGEVNEPMNLTGTLANKAVEPEKEPESLLPEEEAPASLKVIEKGSIAASPQGVGEVKAIRNGKALIEVSGKTHQVNEDELESTIYSEDEIADAYEDYFKKVPEAERSGFISWAGYNEKTRTLGYIPRGGNYEELTNITPEEAEIIKTGKGVARTSGKRTEGLWVMGGDTRGLISQIMHDRRRKYEAEEKKQLKLFDLPKPEKQEKVGMKTIYDENAYARHLSETRKKKIALEARAKKKKEKEEEIARLKREIYEAKKRKKQA